MKKIIYQQTQEMLRATYGDAIANANPDGLLAIVTPAKRGGITEEASLKSAIEKLPTGVQFSVVDASTIPQDRKDRNKWVLQNGALQVKRP